MEPIACIPIYRRQRYPADVITQVVFLYYRFPLSFRMVEYQLAIRGYIVSHLTIRIQVKNTDGSTLINCTVNLVSAFCDKWHLDECVVPIVGKKQWLWRVVDANGFVRDILAQSRRNKRSEKRFIIKQLKAQGMAPFVMIKDKLRSYGAAK